MKRFFLLGLLFLAGCGASGEVMTRDKYAEVEVGMTTQDLQKQYGKPYQIVSKGEGQETYEYIEKITMGTQVIEQRRYYIVIENGKVVGKYMKVSNPPPFEAIYSDDPYPNY